MSYFLRDIGAYGEMGTYLFAKVLYKSRNLCGNFCKAKLPTYEAICIYALTGFSVPLFSNTHLPSDIQTSFSDFKDASVRPENQGRTPPSISHHTWTGKTVVFADTLQVIVQ
jgi:hypothetical protein